MTATFGYGTDGRRSDRTINGATMTYLYDGLNPLQEKVNGVVAATMTSAGDDGWQLRESGRSSLVCRRAFGSAVTMPGRSTGVVAGVPLVPALPGTPIVDTNPIS